MDAAYTGAGGQCVYLLQAVTDAWFASAAVCQCLAVTLWCAVDRSKLMAE